jgi:hypothetical protein
MASPIEIAYGDDSDFGVAGLASLRSADSRGGYPYMSCGSVCEQQVPFDFAQGRLSCACGALGMTILIMTILIMTRLTMTGLVRERS